MPRLVWIVLAMVCFPWGLVARAQAPTETTPTETTIAAGDSGLSELVTNLVQANLPDNYEKKKNWGQTTEIFDHFEVERKGLKIETRRKYKAVNHGTWTMYRITLPHPEQFTVRVSNVRQLADGRAGFDAEFETPLVLFGRLSQWQHGLQLISLSADATARVKLQTTCAVGMKLIPTGKLIPDVQLEPEVLSAKLEMSEFRLHRLSQLHGPLAKHLGTEAREIIEDELVERNADLHTKINKQLAKKQDKLRISLPDLVSTKFGDLTGYVKK